MVLTRSAHKKARLTAASTHGGDLVTHLPPDSLTGILSFLWYDDLVRLSWCDKTLYEKVTGYNAITPEEGLFVVSMRRAKEFHQSKMENDSSWSQQGLKAMQALTVKEIFRGFTSTSSATCQKALAALETSLYEAELDPAFDLDEFEMYAYAGNAVSLCFGFIVSLSHLWDAIYPGRRWYKDETLLSQPLSETPYEGKDEYTEIDTLEEDRPNGWWFGNELPYGDPRLNAETRPPGLKAWKGPHLRSHLQTAIKDYTKRLGNEMSDIMIKDLSDHFTGGAESGVQVAVGIHVGKRFLPAECFDTYKATGHRLLSAHDFGYEIKQASHFYAATTMGWNVNSTPFKKTSRAMAGNFQGLFENLVDKPGIVCSDLGFFFVSCRLP